MEHESMTALVSAFSRAYHRENSTVRVFDDPIAKKLFYRGEYEEISQTMAAGISFFNPAFSGSPEAALRWIVDHQLSPSPLGRAAFAESELAKAVSQGAGQYLILGAGCDTFACRQPDWAKNLRIFELDHPVTAKQKRMRLEKAGILPPDNVHFLSTDFTRPQWPDALIRCGYFDGSQVSFCSLLGVVYYLGREVFEQLISAVGSIVPRGSKVALDYPDGSAFSHNAGAQAKKQAALAKAADEEMHACYSYGDMEEMLSRAGFDIAAHLTPAEITGRYFASYNQANPGYPIAALEHVNYCLGVKR